MEKMILRNASSTKVVFTTEAKNTKDFLLQAIKAKVNLRNTYFSEGGRISSEEFPNIDISGINQSEVSVSELGRLVKGK